MQRYKKRKIEVIFVPRMLYSSVSSSSSIYVKCYIIHNFTLRTSYSAHIAIFSPYTYLSFRDYSSCSFLLLLTWCSILSRSYVHFDGEFRFYFFCFGNVLSHISSSISNGQKCRKTSMANQNQTRSFFIQFGRLMIDPSIRLHCNCTHINSSVCDVNDGKSLNKSKNGDYYYSYEHEIWMYVCVCMFVFTAQPRFDRGIHSGIYINNRIMFALI